MLYIFKDKIYVKPFDNKIVEVSITKENGEYNVKAIKAPLELNDELMKQVSSITLEDAYKFQNKEETKKILNR